MNLKAIEVYGVCRVIPCARWKDHNAGSDALTNSCCCQTGTAIVENANDIAVINAAGLRVNRVDACNLSLLFFRFSTGDAEIQLAVQPGNLSSENSRELIDCLKSSLTLVCADSADPPWYNVDEQDPCFEGSGYRF